jgi:sugar transferase EpsL
MQRKAGLHIYFRWGKRLFDLALTVPALILIFPVLALLCVLIYYKLGSPVLFHQTRLGLNGKPFVLHKFRTMTAARDDRGELLPDSERLTSLGRLLRAVSLDELPELINVVCGEMSLVGPRPLLMRYKPYFNQRERQRFSVLPGITGWAQIHGRNEASWDQRLEYDAWYVEHQSLWLDAKILALTSSKVFTRRGVVVDPHSSMRDLDEERAGMVFTTLAETRETPSA